MKETTKTAKICDKVDKNVEDGVGDDDMMHVKKLLAFAFLQRTGEIFPSTLYLILTYAHHEVALFEAQQVNTSIPSSTRYNILDNGCLSMQSATVRQQKYRFAW